MGRRFTKCEFSHFIPEESSSTSEPPVSRKRRKRSTNSTTTTSSSSKTLRKSNSANTLLGLTILLYPDQEQYDKVGLNNFYGFRVLVHNPYSFAEVTGKGFAVGRGREVFVAVTAQYTNRFIVKLLNKLSVMKRTQFSSSTEDVRGMNLEKRKCVLRNEDVSGTTIHSAIFDDYTREGCLLECRAEILDRACGCLPYYFPDFSSFWNRSTTCNETGLKCLAKQTSKQINSTEPFIVIPFICSLSERPQPSGGDSQP